MDFDATHEEPQEPAARGSGIVRLLRRVWPAQQVPAPFRDSDFEASEWGWSPLDAQPRRAE